MASSYFTRTPASVGNRQTFTLSAWVKRSASLGSYQQLFGTDPSNIDVIGFDNNNKFRIYIYNNSTSTIRISTQVFRDVSAWYHVVVAFDTPNATAQNRCRIYINGTEITTWDTNNTVTQNLNTNFNNNVIQYIGRYVSGEHFDGLMSNVYMIDGQALTPSSFGETDATTGIWKPKSYTGSYGTNGFFLKFESSGSLGTDSSGNGNNFTVNGTPTQTLDTPSNVFTTISPLAKNANNVGASSLTNGNLTVTAPGQQGCSTFGIPITSGTKWYYEFKGISSIGSTTDLAIGWATNISAGNTGASNWAAAGTLFFMSTSGQIYNAGWGSGGTSWTNGDVIGCALDLSANSIKWYKNGTLVYTLSSISFVGDIIFPFTQWDSGSAVGSFNFGNGYFTTTAISSPYSDAASLGKFQYQPPASHYSICTKNINVYG